MPLPNTIQPLFEGTIFALINHYFFEALANIINAIPWCRNTSNSINCVSSTRYTGQIMSVLIFNVFTTPIPQSNVLVRFLSIIWGLFVFSVLNYVQDAITSLHWVF